MTEQGAVQRAEPRSPSGGPGLSPTRAARASTPCCRPGARSSACSRSSTAERPLHRPRRSSCSTGSSSPLALAIDNARWFGRLRTVGADEERTRIARDLHDRIGQSLAYLAFELDRIVRTARPRASNVGEPLDHLRDDVRGVIREVRDTLYDLRTDVTEAQDMSATLEAFLDRVHERSGLAGQPATEERGRLPILQEREMWRIAQEALTNVERHARATSSPSPGAATAPTAALEVTDDGIGLPDRPAGRLDSYGLLGMRERASSIGATLDVDSEPGRGTRGALVDPRCATEQLRPHVDGSRQP